MSVNKKTNYFIIGCVAIVVGIFALIFLLCAFKYVWWEKFNEFDELAGMIGATTGICFSMAGLFFVLDNLKLQRVTLEHQQISIDQQKTAIDQQNISLELQRTELKNQNDELIASNVYFKAQNESLQFQQYQTTYFKLLENHSNLLDSLSFTNGRGINGLEALSLNSDIITNHYLVGVATKYFREFGVTTFFPGKMITSNIDSFEAYMRSMKTLIEMITVHLKDNELYHNILYNYLSVKEKYFLGLYVFIMEDTYSEYIKTSSFNYSMFFEENYSSFITHYKDYFPALAFKRTSTRTSFTQHDFASFFDCEVTYLEDFKSLGIKVKYIVVELIDIDTNEQRFNEKFFLDEIECVIFENGFAIKITDKIKKVFVPVKNARLNYNFTFLYNSNTYLVRSSFGLQTDRPQHPNTTIFISTFTENSNNTSQLFI